MKKKLSFALIAAVVIGAVSAQIPPASEATPALTSDLYGNSAAKADFDLTIEDMLMYALQDEYLARAEYLAIMRKFGTINPFANIERSERSHIAWLSEAFGTRGLTIPEDEGSLHAKAPGALKEAFEVGVQAEIDNIAMYEKFLATPEIREPANSALASLFDNLKRASENHLAAFSRQLAKY